MSFLDPINKTLNKAIFDINNNFIDEKLEEIKSYLYRIVPESVVDRLFLLGSMAGYQYNENSDIDITVFLKPNVEREVYHVKKKLIAPIYLSGTNHEITFFFVRYIKNPKFEDVAYAVYDLTNDKFIVDPKKIEYNPNKKFEREIWFANKIIQELKRDVEDHLKDKIILNKLSPYTESFKAKKREIDREVNDIIMRYRNIDRDRKIAYSGGFGIPRESYQNILYKLLERNNLNKILRALNNEFL